MTASLVPASNFKAVNFKGKRVLIDGGYINLAGWGIYSKSDDAHVSLHSVPFQGVDIPVPYALTKKAAAVFAFSKGLEPGYKLVEVV